MTTMELQPDEVEIVGEWVLVEKRMTADENEFRIKWLIEHSLERLATVDGGWSSLYRDRRDRRLWEVTYPRSEMQGGGPKIMKLLSEDEAAKKYSYLTR